MNTLNLVVLAASVLGIAAGLFGIGVGLWALSTHREEFYKKQVFEREYSAFKKHQRETEEEIDRQNARIP